MEKKNNISSEAAGLRRKAEERLKKISKKTILPKTNEELLRLVNELQTHQIELEIINEELEDSREDVEEGLKQYTDLYDFAPAGYFNLKRDGTVCRANLTGSSMLGVDRAKLLNSRFGLFISEETRPAFNELLQKVFKSKIKTSCEVSLLKEGNELFYVHIDATAGIDGQECKMTMADITGRKRAEEVLRESELRFKQVSESAREWIWEVDSNCKYTYVSPVIKELLGYEAKELVGIKYFYDFFDPENKEEIKQAALGRFARKESIRNFINCKIHKDGRKIILSTTGIPILDKKNNLIGYRGTDVDITERLRAEETIKESEERFHSLFENSTIGLYRTTPQGDILLANQTMIRMLGFDNIDELAQRNLEQKGYEPDYPRSKFKSEIEKSGYIIGLVSKWTKKDGTTLDVHESAHAIRDSNGKTLYYDGTVEDITERKKAEEEILNLARFPSENPNPVLRIARDGTLLFVNESGVSLLADWHLQVGKEAPPVLQEAVFQSMHNITTQVLDLDYGERVYSFHIAPIVAADYANLYGRDITGRIRTEQELIAAKEKAESANKLKDAFIANISHEIRTPLTGILGMTSIIKETYQSNIKEGDEVLFEGIDISSNRIIRTVDMILNYSRLHIGEFNITPNKINISLICTNLVKEFHIAAKNKSLELSFRNNCGSTAIFADEYSITMAISNLLDNAIKYTNKGSVNVILHKEKNDDLILDVKDTGIGINQEYLDHIFEPYLQEEMGYGRAYEGIGLGLAIVKKVINLNKCVINVESKKGEGTTFSINFGKGEQLIENKSKKVIAPNILLMPEELQNKVVLLVEDDLMNQVTIRRFIENNYSVIITPSSDEAMEILKKEKVDIILMDITIKGSRNGLELTKELRVSKEFSHIPIIAVTAHAFESDKINSLAAGCDDYLPKPFTKESLLNIIALYAHK